MTNAEFIKLKQAEIAELKAILADNDTHDPERPFYMPLAVQAKLMDASYRLRQAQAGRDPWSG
jgi:hypothetical protein